MKLFLDTNPLVALLTKAPGWDEVFEIINNPKNKLFTNYFVLNEALYKLLYIKTSEKLNTKNKFEITKFMKKKSKFIREVHSNFMKFYLNIKFHTEILSFGEKEQLISLVLSQKYNFLPTDSAILATMKLNKIEEILTNDKDFNKVKDINVIKF